MSKMPKTPFIFILETQFPKASTVANWLFFSWSILAFMNNFWLQFENFSYLNLGLIAGFMDSDRRLFRLGSRWLCCLFNPNTPFDGRVLGLGGGLLVASSISISILGRRSEIKPFFLLHWWRSTCSSLGQVWKWVFLKSKLSSDIHHSLDSVIRDRFCLQNTELFSNADKSRQKYLEHAKL